MNRTNPKETMEIAPSLRDAASTDLSVIISLKNGANHLAFTLESLISQENNTRIEVIIIDSNSSDAPYYVAQEYASKGLQIIFHSSYDNSIYEAWNKAIEISKSPYLTFVGAGDIILKDSLKKLLKYLEANEDIDILTSQSIDVYPNGFEIIRGKPYSKAVFSRIFSINHTGVIYKKKLFRKFGNFSQDYRYSSDYEFLLRVSSLAKFGYLKIIVSKYIYGGASSSSMAPLIESYNIRKRYNAIPKKENRLILLRSVISFLAINFIIRYSSNKVSRRLLLLLSRKPS